MSTVMKKVCLLGDFSVGKTSLVRRFVEGRFDDRYLSTIGVKISRKELERETHTLNLLIWDLAGSEEFEHVSQRYLLGASGALIVCDLTRPDTVAVLEDYAEQMTAMNPDVAIVLIGNKVDLVEERAVEDDTIAAAAEALGRPWLLTSAKSGEKVDDAFLLLADQIES